jgi:Protein of unknown function (DUF1571)
MMRTLALLALVVVLTGCSKEHTWLKGSRAQGPFAQRKEPPPPYGSVKPAAAITPKPVANQSPLGIASADPQPLPPPAEPALIPPKVAADAEADGRPPIFKRRPKNDPPAPKEKPKTPGADAPGSPGAPQADAKNLAATKELLATAAQSWKAIDTFEATLTRREVNPKGDLNSEVLVFQFRREPMSLFTRTISGMGKGRETVYYPGKYGDKLHVMLGEGDSKLARAGFIAPPISPDDSRVKEKARYSVRDSGLGKKIDALAAVAEKIEAGKLSADALVHQGEVRRDESAYPLVGLTQKLRPGDDPLMPTGGTRQFFFDLKKGSPAYGLPVLIVATDPKGKEVEYYHFEKFKSPAGLTDADFNPARLGKK